MQSLWYVYIYIYIYIITIPIINIKNIKRHPVYANTSAGVHGSRTGPDNIAYSKSGKVPN
jgi:hypothetical protein